MSRVENREAVPLYGAAASEGDQRAAFRDGGVPVAVYGLGKIGLPLAAVYADVTSNTVGVDIDESVVETVNAGDCHVEREPGLPELVSRVVDSGSLRAVADSLEAAQEAAVHVVIVPTLLTEGRVPDLSAVKSVVRAVGAGLDPGDLVLVECTVPPRTCVDLVAPILKRESGLAAGDFGVAACPERTVGGQALADIRGTHPKVVGGVDAESTRAAALVYDELSENEVITVSDATVAEAVKVFEGVYRDVNIALANQLARYAGAFDVDVTEAIDVANTQPFCDIHDPGPGVGGHCIPVYPYFLASRFDVDASLLRVAREVNDGMPAYTAEVVERLLAAEGRAVDGARVLLLGLTYKENIAETRNAPSRPLARLLGERGATVLAADPLVDDWDSFEGVSPVPVEACTAQSVDAVVLVTPHDEFASLDWSAFDAPILDGRQAIDAAETDATVYTLGGRLP